MKKVYVLQTVFENGLKYEGSYSVEVFDTEGKAVIALEKNISDMLTFFGRNYETEDVHIERVSQTYAEVYACDWDDCVTFTITEEKVQ